MEGKDPLELDLSLLPGSALVTDVVYTPLMTPLLEQAKARGNPVVDGLGMLLHQAVPGFEAWFGVRPEVTEELTAACVRRNGLMIRSAAGFIERAFTAFIVVGALAGLIAPDVFLWLRPYIPLLLGWVMFTIGLTIHTEHLKMMVMRPLLIVFAFGKFAVMPWVAYGAALLLQLPPEAVMGMVILGACPGGVSANVMSYLAKANTAVNVLLTILTTLLSPILTPWIIYFFFRHSVTLDMWAMMERLFWVILFPMADAFILRRFLMRHMDRVQWVFPSLSMLMIALIIAFVAAANRIVLMENPWLPLAAVMIFNFGGYAIGYVIARLMRCDTATCQSVGFEYGIQDSALGIIIATGFFSALAALPSAICSLVQNITGPWLAQRYAKRRIRMEEARAVA